MHVSAQPQVTSSQVTRLGQRTQHNIKIMNSHLSCSLQPLIDMKLLGVNRGDVTMLIKHNYISELSISVTWGQLDLMTSQLWVNGDQRNIKAQFPVLPLFPIPIQLNQCFQKHDTWTMRFIFIFQAWHIICDLWNMFSRASKIIWGHKHFLHNNIWLDADTCFKTT